MSRDKFALLPPKYSLSCSPWLSRGEESILFALKSSEVFSTLAGCNTSARIRTQRMLKPWTWVWREPDQRPVWYYGSQYLSHPVTAAPAHGGGIRRNFRLIAACLERSRSTVQHGASSTTLHSTHSVRHVRYVCTRPSVQQVFRYVSTVD